MRPVEREAIRVAVPFDVIDLATAPEFLRWAREHLPTGEAGPRIVLDLADVEFVMAAGVQALLDLEAVLRGRGQTLVVADPAPIVMQVLAICGVAERWVAT